jgi:hypothetical protein
MSQVGVNKPLEQVSAKITLNQMDNDYGDILHVYGTKSSQ